MEETLWRPVEGYEGLYEVSNQGQVKSLERRVRSGQRGGYRVVQERILKSVPSNKDGHVRVALCSQQGRVQAAWVHRLVAQAFIPNPNKLPFVLHGPGGPADNRVSNLRWGDMSANMRDRFAFGKGSPVRTRCKRNHDMTDETNIYSPPGKPQVRVCKKCRRLRKQARRLT